MLTFEKPRTPSASRTVASGVSTDLRGRLVAIEPFVTLLEMWEHEAALVCARLPDSEYASMVRSFRTELLRTVEKARHAELWVSIDRLSELTGKPKSTLRAMCTKHGKEMGAKKMAGTWNVYLPTFNEYANPNTMEAAA